MTLIFFVVSAGVNKAFDFGVSQPFVIVFRSGSLLISFLVGLWLYKKKYSLGHFMAVLIVTIGVIATTLAEAEHKQHATKAPNNPVGCLNCNNNDLANTEAKAQAEYFSWIIGTTIVFVTMVLLAVLGYVQGQAYEKYGKHPEEMVFYTHLLPLPMFMLFGNESIRVMKVWTVSDPVTFLSITIPIAWGLILINCITQYFCINGVHHVTANLGTLTCTFITTVRKFLSLILSIVYFQHEFTTQHWAGTALVALGSFLYIWADVAATNANAKKQAELAKKKQN
jgi:UDP-xylose/UDP-N-acetylglucosamine transporter B4